MTDIVLEIIRAIIISMILIYLWSVGKKEGIAQQKGWAYILAGFGFLFLGMIIDITDNFPALNKYVIIGDTEYQAFLEKVGGFLVGFLLLAVGFWKWIPTVVALKETQHALEKSRNELDVKVKERTASLQVANEQLLQEVTDRKQAETNLEQERNLLVHRVEERTAELRSSNEQLRHALQARDNFLAIMSHELRTPLNGVLGMADILQRDIYGPLNQKQQQAVTLILNSGQHLLTLVNDILTLTQLESGKMKLNIEPILIKDLCRGTLASVRKKTAEKQLNVSLTADDTLEIMRGDSLALKRILVNLLDNAIKFTPAGGQIGLKVEAVEGQNFINLIVWDNGIGIEPEVIDQLFKPFFQTDSRLSRHYEGTGLGLALVYRLTVLHEGRVAVKSNVGQGSEFVVSLPLTLEKSETV